MAADLLVIVPTRGRPGNITRMIQAFDGTIAWADADLAVVYDADDPTRGEYQRIAEQAGVAGHGVWQVEVSDWQPMVRKLEDAADQLAAGYTAVGFMGDDHAPRTVGWAKAYLEALAELGTGVVFGDDLHRGQKLCTQWAMTTDIVAALGRMIPADVDHLYSDTSVMDLAREAGCLRYLPNVVVEHMHYVVGKAPEDAGYQQVNSPEQYANDGARYQRWKETQLAADVAKVRKLRGVSS
jgi:hypothetical protein